MSVLYNICEKNDKYGLMRMLKNGVNVNKKNKFGDRNVPLHAACYKGHREIVDILLQHGANVDEANNSRDTPLCMACKNGHHEVAKLLLKNGACVNGVDTRETPLYMACMNGHHMVAKLLLENGACIDSVYVRIILERAIIYGHHKVAHIELLLENGANINHANEIYRSDHDCSLLHLTCIHNNYNIAKLLLQYGMNVNEKNYNGQTPLHIACMYDGRYSIIKLLLNNGANIHEKNRFGFTPMMIIQNNNANKNETNEIKKRIYILSLIVNRDVLKHYIMNKMDHMTMILLSDKKI